MGYTQFKNEVLSRARKKVASRYEKMVGLLLNEDHFILQDSTHHKERINHFLFILKELYGPFTVENSNDHTTVLRNCFLNRETGCPLSDASDLSHIITIKESSRIKMITLLEDIDEYSFLVCEEVL